MLTSWVYLKANIFGTVLGLYQCNPTRYAFCIYVSAKCDAFPGLLATRMSDSGEQGGAVIFSFIFLFPTPATGSGKQQVINKCLLSGEKMNGFFFKFNACLLHRLETPLKEDTITDIAFLSS